MNLIIFIFLFEQKRAKKSFQVFLFLVCGKMIFFIERKAKSQLTH